jgi:hypothetical protein
MSVDRILQLKLVADVSNISSAADEVVGETSKIKGAFSGLKAFVGPVMLDLGLQAGAALMDGLSGGFADAAAYDRAFGELQANVDKLGTDVDASELAGTLDSISFDLGFDDAETLGAFNELVTRTGNVDDAMTALQASFDLSAARGIELGAAAAEVGNIFKGEGEKLAEWGVHGEATKNSIENVTTALGHLGDEAETRASSIEGIGDRVGVAMDRGFATAASTITDLAETVLPKLAALWDEIGPDVIAFAEKIGQVATQVVELGLSITEKLRPVLDPLIAFLAGGVQDAFANISDVLDAITKLLDGDFTGAWKSIENVIYRMVQRIIGTINSIGNAIAGFLDPFIDGFRGAINTVIGFWNGLGVHIPEIVLFEGFGRRDTFGPIDIELPDIPLLAAGGIVTAPTLAMIGEGGPEAVVPLDHGALGTSYTINVQAGVSSPADVGRAVVQAIEAYERRAGRGWRR